MYVEERFTLNPLAKRSLRDRTPNFGFDRLGEIVYARTYSRLRNDGSQERWDDTIIRVVEGVGSIRKDWYVKHHLPWNEEAWQLTLTRMAYAMFDMHFLPGGRGLWAMGTDYVYERGSAALYNCAYVDVKTLSKDASWGMDFLMCGIGLGFGNMNASFDLRAPNEYSEVYVIPDTREGWAESIRLLIRSYEKGSRQIVFDYSQIRPAGSPIAGFGGTASGSEPLEKLHHRLRVYMDSFVAGQCSRVRLIQDVFNAIGACVVAGNVRRSAEISLGSPLNEEFLNLKNYDVYPERGEIGWMSNNSIVLQDISEFRNLPDIAERIRANGEPGVMNLLNVQQYGRYGDEMFDSATGTNPCAEVGLESYETCNLTEVFPTRTRTAEEFYNAHELAQIYGHTVSLLPTHSPETNEVIARNRRIGQSNSGIADWFDEVGATDIVTMLRESYKLIRETNRRLAKAAGVPESIRVTAVKPSGTISQLAGVSSGMHYPVYRSFIRRIRFGADTQMVPLLQEANVPYEEDAYSDNTLVFSFPVLTKARRAQRDLTMWQKAAMVIMLQRHYADNMVSNTITFDPKTEGHQIEDLLAFTVPFTKTISLLPDTDEGVYVQMPYEQKTVKEVQAMQRQIKEIDWSKFGNSDGQDSRFCNNDTCEV